MIESMILKVITFFVDVGDWFKKNFFHHNPHEVKKVEETIEATPEVKSAKEFMQQSIETVSKAQQDLNAKIIEDVKQVEDVEIAYHQKFLAELAQFVETETKVAEKLVEEVEEVVADVAEVVEETAKKVKKSTRKKKTEED